ncbi:MAG: helix-turn-helix transcriptional regulator [Gammaproteobacteria bacterium]|nr:helix-turn-helix transcriptional regulator [Gammaproteobacteria bacterium]
MIISDFVQTALSMLGSFIRIARIKRKMPQSELAERLNVSRQTVMAIEKGRPNVAVGVVFEAARILGIPLLNEEKKVISRWQELLGEFQALMPSRVDKGKEIDDDF